MSFSQAFTLLSWKYTAFWTHSTFLFPALQGIEFGVDYFVVQVVPLMSVVIAFLGEKLRKLAKKGQTSIAGISAYLNEVCVFQAYPEVVTLCCIRNSYFIWVN